MIEATDITEIFKAIVVFLNGGGYTDPFEGTPKKAKIIPRTANIKPRTTSTSVTTEGRVHNLSTLNEGKLNEIAYLCLGDIIIEKNKSNKMNKNRIRLTESQLHRIINESVKNIVNEQNNTVLMQILTTYINGLQKYVSAGQYQQALKVSQVITAKINALMQQASQQQMQQNQQSAQQAQPYQQNALG